MLLPLFQSPIQILSKLLKAAHHFKQCEDSEKCFQIVQRKSETLCVLSITLFLLFYRTHRFGIGEGDLYTAL